MTTTPNSALIPTFAALRFATGVASWAVPNQSCPPVWTGFRQTAAPSHPALRVTRTDARPGRRGSRITAAAHPRIATWAAHRRPGHRRDPARHPTGDPATGRCDRDRWRRGGVPRHGPYRAGEPETRRRPDAISGSELGHLGAPERAAFRPALVLQSAVTDSDRWNSICEADMGQILPSVSHLPTGHREPKKASARAPWHRHSPA